MSIFPESISQTDEPPCFPTLEPLVDGIFEPLPTLNPEIYISRCIPLENDMNDNMIEDSAEQEFYNNTDNSIILGVHESYNGPILQDDVTERLLKIIKRVEASWFPDSLESYDNADPIKINFFTKAEYSNPNEGYTTLGFVPYPDGLVTNTLYLNLELFQEGASDELLFDVVKHEFAHMLLQDSITQYQDSFHGIICDPEESQGGFMVAVDGYSLFWTDDSNENEYYNYSDIIIELHAEFVTATDTNGDVDIFKLSDETLLFWLRYNFEKVSKSFSEIWNLTSPNEIRDALTIALDEESVSLYVDPDRNQSSNWYSFYREISQRDPIMEKNFCDFIVSEAQNYQVWKKSYPKIEE
jgi:hypothetical protein